MTTGIIYVARNEVSDPPNHYKIGKSTKADPDIRMMELNSAEVNYRGRYICLGHVLVNNVDECELKMHRLFSRERVNNRKEFFDVDLRSIITSIRMNLAQDIINDNLPNIEGLGGVYRLSNKELFSLINDFDSFNFLELCKISFQKGLNARFHGIPDTCMFYLLFLLGNKTKIAKEIEFNPDFEFYFDQHIGGNYNDLNLGEKIQAEVLKTDMKEYFLQIPYDYNLLYLGVLLCFVEQAEKKNNVLEKFIIKNLSEIYLHNTNFSEVMKNFKEIINNNQYLSWVQLEALTPLFQS